MKNFNRRYVKRLIDEGVGMVYGKLSKNTLGLWHPDTNLIVIRPDLEQRIENVTIVHEWNHAYIDLILQGEYRESQIDFWAYFHIRRDPLLPAYIKSFFSKEGF